MLFTSGEYRYKHIYTLVRFGTLVTVKQISYKIDRKGVFIRPYRKTTGNPSILTLNLILWGRVASR